LYYPFRRNTGIIPDPTKRTGSATVMPDTKLMTKMLQEMLEVKRRISETPPPTPAENGLSHKASQPSRELGLCCFALKLPWETAPLGVNLVCAWKNYAMYKILTICGTPFLY
jgi:hypothetical protein